MSTTGRRAAVGVAIFLLIGLLCAQPLALAAIGVYQRTLSPAAARLGMRCRFEPSCSVYAETVIARDGIVEGGRRALARLARCHPGTPIGTVDPP